MSIERDCKPYFMNHENIRAFLEVATTGSFQRAAENMHITQSAMSARIKSLEERLNRQLFFRNRNGASLTSGGQRFLPYATSMIRSWEQACSEIMLSDTHEQVVGLGIQYNHWHDTGRQWLQWMQNQAPKIATHIRIDYSDLLISRLRDGILDIAIVYEPQSRADVTIETYATQELLLVSTSPRKVTQGLNAGYVYVDWGHTFQNIHNQLYPNAPYYQIAFGISEAAFHHMMRHGGSGYFLKSYIEPLLEEETLFLVEGAKSIPITTYLMVSTDRKNHHEIQTALQALEEIKP